MFLNHLKENNVSYLQHLRFAAGVSVRLFASSVYFIVHALLPFVPIPYWLNLESTALYLFEKNNELED